MCSLGSNLFQPGSGRWGIWYRHPIKHPVFRCWSAQGRIQFAYNRYQVSPDSSVQEYRPLESRSNDRSFLCGGRHSHNILLCCCQMPWQLFVLLLLLSTPLEIQPSSCREYSNVKWKSKPRPYTRFPFETKHQRERSHDQDTLTPSRDNVEWCLRHLLLS